MILIIDNPRMMMCFPFFSGGLALSLDLHCRDKAAAIAEKIQENHPRQLTIANAPKGIEGDTARGCNIYWAYWAYWGSLGCQMVSWFHQFQHVLL